MKKIMKKRGQVTLFIIIGIVILVLVGIYIAFLGEQTPTFQTGTEDFSSMRVFVESGLKTYSEDAIIKIGEGGGYINSLDFLTSDYKKEYSDIETAVGIESIYMLNTNRYGTWISGDYKFAKPVPSYPWSGFSRETGDHFSQQHRIGRPITPPLEISSAQSATTVRREMEEYIEEGIQGLNIKENFENQFDIEIDEEPNVTVTFGEGQTLVELEYPINMTHRGTRDVKRMESYAIELPIDFRTLYRFIEEAFHYETTDFKFDINDPTLYDQLPSHKDEFRVSIIDLEAEFDLIMFIYNQTHDDEYTFRSVRQNRIPAMYDLIPKTYDKVIDGEEEQIDYEIDEGVDLNFHHDSSEGFEEFSGSILDYILDPETVEQAVDPDELDELTFTYGKSSDCPYYDEITFSVIENTGDFSIEYPKHHINLVNYTCETRVFVSDQADAPVKDYESVYFQHTGRECIGDTQGVCYECCLDGCIIESKCCDPRDDCICDVEDDETYPIPDYSELDHGDSEHSFDSDSIPDDFFLELNNVIEGTNEKGDCLKKCQECIDGCAQERSECRGDCDGDYEDCMDDDDKTTSECISERSECRGECDDDRDNCEDSCPCVVWEKCCDYCDDPCGPGCEIYPSP